MTEIEKTIRTNNESTITYRVSYYLDHLTDTAPPTTNHYAIFLLHGLASNMTRWTEFVANTSLTQSVDLLRMDLRGHGKSMVHNRISTKDWCEDILKIVNAEKYSKIIIVGHSLGAQIAMQFVFNYPEYCHGVVLIDPVFPSALKGVLGFIRRFRYGLLVFIYLLLIKAKTGIHKKKFPIRDLYELDITTRDILYNDSGSNIAKLYMNPFDDLTYIPLLNYCQDMFEVTRKIPDLKRIKCAVLCLLSRGATVSDIELTKSFVTQFPDNEIKIIDADHWLLTEKPVESRTAIDNWCTKILITSKNSPD